MDKTKLFSLAILATAIIYSASMPPVQAASAAVQQAIDNYNQKQYGAAVDKLTKADRNNPLVHYYLGLSYQALGNFEAAKKEYFWGYKNDRDQSLKYKSWQGFEALSALSRGKGSLALMKRSEHSASNADGKQEAPPGQSAAVSATANRLVGIDGKPVSSDPSQWFQVNWKPGCPKHW